MSESREVLTRIEQGLPLLQAPWRTSAEQASYPQAGVLVAVTDEEHPRILLGRRAKHLKTHPGEIAFAGGKRETIDDSPWQTALRETTEEVGIAANLVEALGELEPLVTRTGFQVFPCVGKIAAEPQLTVDPGEFDSVFLPRLSEFADPALYRLEDMSKNGTTLKVPHYQIGNDNVWGVTAAILVQIANVAYDAGLELQRNWKTKT